jgi:hypothetical protein
MIEKIARVLCSFTGIAPDINHYGAPYWHMYIPQAKAVIKAMREPTEKMMRKGRKASCYYDDEANIEGIYLDMIDAALEEKT